MIGSLGAKRRSRRVLGRPTTTVQTGRSRARFLLWPILGVALVVWQFAGLAPALVLMAYGMLALGLQRSRRERAARLARQTESAEMLAGIIAGLRVGARPEPFALSDRDLDRMARSAQRIATRTGAALAEALERVEAHARSQLQVEMTTRAANAGASLTAALLFALPLAGIALGYGIGSDPIDVLVHTRLGAVCLLGGVALQIGGVLWMQRLTRSGTQPSRRPWRGAKRRLSGFAPPAGPGRGKLRRGGDERRHRRAALADFPFAADLAAMVLRAGVPQAEAIAAIAGVVGGPMGERLQWTAGELAMGVAHADAWRHVAGLAPRLAPAVARSADSGSALSGALMRCAEDTRASFVADRQRHGQRVAVLLVLPLGLCFLPAFVLMGLTPVVMAVLGEALKIG